MAARVEPSQSGTGKCRLCSDGLAGKTKFILATPTDRNGPDTVGGRPYLGRDGCQAIQPVHNRMPVLLHPDEYGQWLLGSFDDALAFQKRTFPPELVIVERTSELWAKKKAAPEAPPLL